MWAWFHSVWNLLSSLANHKAVKSCSSPWATLQSYFIHIQMTAKYQRQRKARPMPHKLAIHYFLEALFVGFRKQWATLQVADSRAQWVGIGVFLLPNISLAFSKLFWKVNKGKSLSLVTQILALPRLARLFKSLVLPFTCKLSVSMIYHQICFLLLFPIHFSHLVISSTYLVIHM